MCMYYKITISQNLYIILSKIKHTECTNLECAVVWRGQLLDDVPHEDEALVLLQW